MKFYKNFVVVWTLIYFSIAILGKFYSEKKEYFPFFRWSLYSKTPNKVTTPYILITKIGDSILKPPLNLKDYNHSSYTTVNYVVTKFFDTYQDSNRQATVNDQALLNLLPQDATYSLYINEIDLSKKNFDKKGKSKKIGTFTKSKNISN